MKKSFAILNIFLIAAVFACNYFYITDGGSDLKALTSSLFVLLGLVNLIGSAVVKSRRIRFCVTMTAGLVLAMLGDIMIGRNFIIGALLFALGHIGYFAAQCFIMRFGVRDAACGAVLFAAVAAFLLLCPLLEFGDETIHLLCIAYALIISLMTGKAESDFFRGKSVLTAVLAIGSLLFFFSDLMLVFDQFMGMGHTSAVLCLSTYYPAQCLLAYSIFEAWQNEK